MNTIWNHEKQKQQMHSPNTLTITQANSFSSVNVRLDSSFSFQVKGKNTSENARNSYSCTYLKHWIFSRRKNVLQLYKTCSQESKHLQVQYLSNAVAVILQVAEKCTWIVRLCVCVYVCVCLQVSANSWQQPGQVLAVFLARFWK